jgi:hypothetical protein
VSNGQATYGTSLACAISLLTGCGLADQHATWVPQILRQAGTEPARPEPEPDVKELVRTGVDTLFTKHPIAVSLSRARRNDLGTGFTACVRALVAGPMNPEPQPVTLVLAIEHGRVAERHRAAPEDGCTMEAHQKVDVAQ